MIAGEDIVDVKCFRRDCGIKFKTSYYSVNASKARCPACQQTHSIHMFHEEQAIDTKERCPVCDGPALLSERCRCTLHCVKCPNGHEWHTCGVHKRPALGSGHRPYPQKGGGCTCEVSSGQS
jgi:hypothetical protein